MLTDTFFNKNAIVLAKALLGKVLRVRYKNKWLSAKIIETEAYFKAEKGSHASLGYTEKRKALFMSPGTIYMYYARGGDSLNISAKGEGNAVLIKSGIPYFDDISPEKFSLITMQSLNPPKNGKHVRSLYQLCAGQTLLCKSLGLKVPSWDQQQFNKKHFFIDDIGHTPSKIIKTTRLGIPLGRDEHLPYRFIDYDFAFTCTNNPLTKRKFVENQDYFFE